MKNARIIMTRLSLLAAVLMTGCIALKGTNAIHPSAAQTRMAPAAVAPVAPPAPSVTPYWDTVTDNFGMHLNNAPDGTRVRVFSRLPTQTDWVQVDDFIWTNGMTRPGTPHNRNQGEMYKLALTLP